MVYPFLIIEMLTNDNQEALGSLTIIDVVYTNSCRHFVMTKQNRNNRFESNTLTSFSRHAYTVTYWRVVI